MTAIDRREVLRVLLGGAVVATVGLAMLPDAAKSAPLTISNSLPASTETPSRKRSSLCATAAIGVDAAIGLDAATGLDTATGLDAATAAAGCAGGTGGRQICGWRWS